MTDCVTRETVALSGPLSNRRSPRLGVDVRGADGLRLGRVDVATVDAFRLAAGEGTAFVEPDGDVIGFVAADGSVVRSLAVGWTSAGLPLGLAVACLGLVVGLTVTAARQRRATGSWLGSGERVPFGSAWAALLVVPGCISAFLSRFEVPVAVSLAVLVLGLLLAVLLVTLRVVTRRG